MRSKIVQTICKFLVFAMIATIIPNNLTMTPAAAQSGSKLEEAVGSRKVAVVDFINDSNKFGNIIANNATDAFIMMLEKESKAYEVVSDRNEISAAMSKLGLRQPITKIDAVSLAKELDVDGIVEGYIKNIKIKGENESRIAEVDIVVQYVDRITGDVLVGAETTGSSSARIGFTGTDEDLVLEALNKAVFTVISRLNGFVVPRATVYMSQGSDTVILNAGVRANIKSGMRMVVTRQKTVIGYIEIIKVNDLDSVAKIINQKIGIKPEDICYAIYSGTYVSKYSVKDETISGVSTAGVIKKDDVKKKSNSIAMTALGIAAAVGLVALFSSSGKESSPSISTGTTPGVITIKKASGNLVGKITGVTLYRTAPGGNSESWTYTTDGGKDIDINVFAWNPSNSGTAPSANVQYTYTGEWVLTGTDTDTDTDTDTVTTAKTATSKPFAAQKITRLTSVNASDMTFGPNVYLEDVTSGADVPTWSKITGYDDTTVKLVYRVTFSALNDATITKEFTGITALSSQNTVYLTSAQCAALVSWFEANGVDNTWNCSWKVDVKNTLDSNTAAWTKGISQSFGIVQVPPDPPTAN